MITTGDFDPLDYDIYHVGISGGKDSTATLLWLIYESGWPTSRIIATFCDTGNEDSLTYNYLAMLSDRVFPIQTIDPGIGFYELARKKKRFPSRRARFCTQHLKVIPSLKLIEELKQYGKVLALSGVRKAEGHNMNDRGDLEQFYHDDSYGCDKFMPIYEWTLDDIWDVHRKYLDVEDIVTITEDDEGIPLETRLELIERVRSTGVPRNPLYDMGAKRVGCFPCINSSKKEIRAIAHYRPERIDFIESQEGSFNDNPNMFSSMFARNMVPERWRTKEVITAKGEVMKIATIRDVVAWSKTAWGAHQYELFHRIDDDDPLSCDMRGMCE